MKFTLEQYKKMSKSFNSKSFSEKIKILMENKDILILARDHNWWVVKVIDKAIQYELEEVEQEFSIEHEWDSNQMYDLVYLLGLEVTDI